jgi:hypothetical protein
MSASTVSTATPHPWVDLRLYPIVVIAFPAVAVVSEVLALTIALRRFAAELTEPIALIADLSELRSPDPEGRKVYSEFVRDMRAVAGHRVRAVALITRNPLQRALLNVHSMIVGTTPYPTRGFPSRDQAIPWLHARLGALS